MICTQWLCRTREANVHVLAYQVNAPETKAFFAHLRDAYPLSLQLRSMMCESSIQLYVSSIDGAGVMG